MNLQQPWQHVQDMAKLMPNKTEHGLGGKQEVLLPTTATENWWLLGKGKPAIN